MTVSLFWYDFETTGTDTRRDRPMQVAGVRTDEALNEIGEPLNIYCRLADDILPHPKACLITGIRPQQLDAQGLSEADFMARLHAELAQAGTCSVGYNTLRFDDEITRYSLYRNFFDPYAREWQNGNSRWDIIDCARAMYALRPDGIQWPEENGRISMHLERLTAANGLSHENAHDALSDVRATLGLARLLRDRQPRLFDWCYKLRHKKNVLDELRLLQPVLHVSGQFSAARHFISVVFPLAWHPTNKNALITCNLQGDVDSLLTLSAEELRERLYTRHADLPEGVAPIPIKQIHVNRSPFVAPLKVLRPEDAERVGIDLASCQQKADLLRAHLDSWQPKVQALYQAREFTGTPDPDQQLYDGFIGDRDRSLCVRVREAEPTRLGEWQGQFADARLNALLFRYRARNFAHSLTPAEQHEWQTFCQQRLTDPTLGAPMTASAFFAEVEQLTPELSFEQNELLNEWLEYVKHKMA